MPKRYHHIRILESTYQDIVNIKRKEEKDREVVERIVNIVKELPDKYLVWGIE